MLHNIRRTYRLYSLVVVVEGWFLWHTDIFYASWGNTEISLDLWWNKSILWLMYEELLVWCFSYWNVWNNFELILKMNLIYSKKIGINKSPLSQKVVMATDQVQNSRCFFSNTANSESTGFNINERKYSSQNVTWKLVLDKNCSLIFSSKLKKKKKI